MAILVKLLEQLISEARCRAKESNRSLSEQVEHWANIGKLAEENPDLTYGFIVGIVKSREEVEAGKSEPYTFG